MQEARKLDKQLSDSGVTFVKVKVKDIKTDKLVWKTIDLGGEWTGAESDEEFKILANILKSNSYTIGHFHSDNITAHGFSNLESMLNRK